ncbi:hypothetical protein EDB89DRAFT_1986062, partial [Lactarius sanguifluus]
MGLSVVRWCLVLAVTGPSVVTVTTRQGLDCNVTWWVCPGLWGVATCQCRRAEMLAVHEGMACCPSQRKNTQLTYVTRRVGGLAYVGEEGEKALHH